MNDINALNTLIDQLRIPTLCPADFTTTIDAISTNSRTIMLSANPGGSSNQWVGGVIEIMSGNAVRERQIIVASNGVAIVVASAFGPTRLPEAGDTVKLSGGPLKEARIYYNEPLSVKKDVADGIKYWVNCSIFEGTAEIRALGGSMRRGMDLSLNRTFDFTVMCETKATTGDVTAADVWRKNIELPTLKEQVLLLCAAYRLGEVNKISGKGPLTYSYVGLERPGEKPMDAYIIQFSIQTM